MEKTTIIHNHIRQIIIPPMNIFGSWCKFILHQCSPLAPHGRQATDQSRFATKTVCSPGVQFSPQSWFFEGISVRFFLGQDMARSNFWVIPCWSDSSSFHGLKTRKNLLMNLGEHWTNGCKWQCKLLSIAVGQANDQP